MGCRRPVYGSIEKFQTDPDWHDLLLFHEYFHGDTGAGIGASHQTGWTGIVAHLLCRDGVLDRIAQERNRAAGSQGFLHRAPAPDRPEAANPTIAHAPPVKATGTKPAPAKLATTKDTTNASAKPTPRGDARGR